MNMETLPIDHHEKDCWEEIQKFTSSAQQSAKDGLETSSGLLLRLSAIQEPYFYVKAVRALALLAGATFAPECSCNTAWGWKQARQRRGLPPGFWPAEP